MCKHIRNSAQALGLFLLFLSSAASAGVWVGGGVEYFTWGEYLTFSNYSGDDLLQEKGFRPFVEASAELPLTDRTSLALAGKAYSATVDYDGQTATSNAGSVSFSPYHSTTEYTGVKGEVGVTWTPLPRGDYKDVSFVAMGGLEAWNRKIGGDLGYTEEYQVPFIRLGARMNAPDRGGWTARGGVIFPIHVKEYVRLMDGVELHPDAGPSFYLGIGRRFGRFLEAGFNYEGYRFNTSDLSPALKNHGTTVYYPGTTIPVQIYQPRTESDSYQFYVKVGF